ILLSSITVLTVCLNLLVIISISHFRQLHTSTNLLLLSLAVSDFLVGLLLMPVQILLKEGCWVLGSLTCRLFYYVSFVLPIASVGNMVLISVDRYVAICDPLHYSTKVTLNRIGALDGMLTFIGPISVIITLYMKVFVVAVSQARALRSHTAAVKVQNSVHVSANKSERKAARTLGVVVVVFLICFCPYFYTSIAGQDVSSQDMSSDVEISVFGIWLFYWNSCLNPLIYAFFYPWFRKCIRQIVTL
ncbi:trace amine-associated receptor 1-like, partial [Echeneis naucrates]|uniref:trace amine-associated receptor 1-like n=1 Tax=Echeneis naucrates TaxID=173247 RepID=UPI0011136913